MALNAIIIGGWAALGVYWLIAAAGAEADTAAGGCAYPV